MAEQDSPTGCGVPHPTRSAPHCVNCKHLDNVTNPRRHLCTHIAAPVSPVTGGPTYFHSDCGTGRQVGNWCQPQGYLFEATTSALAAPIQQVDDWHGRVSP